MIRVGILGASGKLGSAIATAVEEAADLELVARVGREDPLELLLETGVQVAVDVTGPDAVLRHVEFCVAHGIHTVVGATGFDVAAIRDPGPVGVLVAPNFAIGALLLMRFAAQAAPFFESVEIVELHHPTKADAPSGTAKHTAQAVAASRAAAGVAASPDATATALEGARGAVVDGVHVHSVRLRGLVAHEEVLLGNAGEALTLRHDSFDRASFANGALAAIRGVGGRPGLTVGLENVLFD